MELMFVLLIGGGIYFLPSILGGVRGKANGMAGVVLLNLFFGWSLIGWIIALVWACSGRTERDVQLEAQRHREIMTALRPHDDLMLRNDVRPRVRS